VDIRRAVLEDSDAIRTVYNHEVLNSFVTLDLIPRSEAEQRHWIAEHSGVYPAIVATIDGKVCGFASLSPYRARAGYSTTVEDSIYVDSDYRKQGIGTALLNHILTLANQHGFHACMARVMANHQASLTLHESCGFVLVGIEREVGRKFGKWLDVAVLERLL
jgi:phosphinothricin acetyltransferase